MSTQPQPGRTLLTFPLQVGPHGHTQTVDRVRLRPSS